MHRWYSVVQNRNLAPAPPMSRPVRGYLQDAFDPQIDRLASLIGRGLSHWH
jgi:hypothetical protein